MESEIKSPDTRPTKTNKAFERFLPGPFLKLIGKRDALSVELGDAIMALLVAVAVPERKDRDAARTLFGPVRAEKSAGHRRRHASGDVRAVPGLTPARGPC